MITIGIDPGLYGAIGVLSDGLFLAVYDMPTVIKSKDTGKLEVCPKQLNELVKRHTSVDVFTSTALERVSAMPGQGVTSMFSLGDSFGCARSALIATGCEFTLVAPQTWKKHFKLTNIKDESLLRARELFTEAPLKLKKHDGRAESLLIARWLYETKFM